MKEEDIENAAREESGIWSPNPVHLHDLYRWDDFEAGFHRGANWRINSVWHEGSEKPDTDKGDLLIIVKDAFGKDVYVRQNAYYVLKYGCKKWAYIKDLIPNMED